MSVPVFRRTLLFLSNYWVLLSGSDAQASPWQPRREGPRSPQFLECPPSQIKLCLDCIHSHGQTP